MLLSFTPCIVAVPDVERVFRGRYVHFDGHPDGAGAQLATIVHREGVATAIRILIDEHVGWVSIQADQPPGPSVTADAVIPGYGVALTEGSDYLDACASGIEWAYVLGPQGITVMRYLDSEWTIQHLDVVVPSSPPDA